MKPGIISRYLIREIVGIFALALTIFTLVLLMGRMVKLMEMVVANGVPLPEVIRLIVLLLPSFLVLTIPMAFLLAVLLAFGRLSSDNEITVLKASGLSLNALLPPVMLCSIMAMGLTLAISVFGVPWGSLEFKKFSVEVAKKYAASAIRERIFRDDIPGVVIYVDSYDEEKSAMKRVMIQDDRDPGRPLTIFARDGVITPHGSQGALRILLRNGSIHVKGSSGEYRQIGFGEYQLMMDSGKTVPIVRTELDMHVGELYRMSKDPAVAAPIRAKTAIELQSRFAFPFAVLVFGILGIPLGIHNKRSGKTSGFATSIAVLLIYYIVLSFLRTLAEKGSLAPEIALWLPNVLFLGIGVFMFRCALQERPVLSCFSRAGKVASGNR